MRRLGRRRRPWRTARRMVALARRIRRGRNKQRSSSQEAGVRRRNGARNSCDGNGQDKFGRKVAWRGAMVVFMARI